MSTLSCMDYSWSRPDPKAMKLAGVKAVARYLWGPGKGIDRDELAALHAAGLGVVLNFEANAGNHLRGSYQGTVDGASARAYAGQLGVPKGTPIYFSCDAEVSPSLMPTVMAYLKAADSADYPARCYAQASVCDAWGRPAWQTMAWSYGAMSIHAVLYQYAIDQKFGDASVDFDEIRSLSALGAWWPDGEAPDVYDPQPIIEGDVDVLVFQRNGTVFAHDPVGAAVLGFTDNASYMAWLDAVHAIGIKTKAWVPSAAQAARLAGRAK